jgi:dihydrofolate synthase/folylpolyglutamate synthase
MDYRETLSYLYEQLPMFTRIGEKAYNKGLDNITALCDKLNKPQQKFRTIHIAGTNGKGSTSHMLAAILQLAGYKTGLYTSPHLFDFRERIRINGEMISEEEVVNFMQRILPVDISPSFFEFTVAMAFDHFARQAVDIAVIETGLGGRLDSTNIIDPEMSVITNIGWDHMNLLGNSLEAIATEKAGIIKKNKPVIIGECLPETLPVFQKMARELSAPLVLAEETFDLLNTTVGKDSISSKYRNRESGENMEVITGSGGLYQANNTRTVLTAVNRLRKQGFFIDDDALRKGLLDFRKITGLRGRWEMIGRAPDIIAEVAHNKDGIRKVLDQLNHQYPEAGYHFVLGFVRDKDIDEILSLFPKNANYYFTNAHMPRALPHEELKEKANSFLPDGPSFDDVNEALAAAKSRAKEADVIMILGSFFILSELKLP